MPFAEDVSIFFNADDFSEQAVINGKAVSGLFSYGTVLVNEVETRKALFACAEAEIPLIRQGCLVQLHQQRYQAMGIKPDGTGIIVLVLEKISED